jgi:hypothetical protein
MKRLLIEMSTFSFELMASSSSPSASFSSSRCLRRRVSRLEMDRIKEEKKRERTEARMKTRSRHQRTSWREELVLIYVQM